MKEAGRPPASRQVSTVSAQTVARMLKKVVSERRATGTLGTEYSVLSTQYEE